MEWGRHEEADQVAAPVEAQTSCAISDNCRASVSPAQAGP